MNFSLAPIATRGLCVSFSSSRFVAFQSILIPFRTLVTRPAHSSPPSRPAFSLRASYITNCQTSLHPQIRTYPPSPIQSRAMSTNGESRPKRRHSLVTAHERPTKHLKQEISVPTPGDSTPANGTVYDIENEPEPVAILNALQTTGDSPEWQATIENVIKSVVSIHFCQTCSFDTDFSTSSQATGFVVDAERGYIMTNRHVVCSGPFWGYCLFENHEEVRMG